MLSDQLNDILDHLSKLQFEVVLVIGALATLTGGLISKKEWLSKGLYGFTLLLAMIFVQVPSEAAEIFDGVWVHGPLENTFKLLFGGIAIWVIAFPEASKRSSEYYFLLISMVIGSVFMLSANHLLLIYLAIELTSFASYILTNFDFDKRSFEAGIKYLLFGGVSAAIGLYGASLIYGYTGTLILSEMNFNLVNNPPLLNFGILAFTGALFFKISLVPFHIWTPSAYQKIPTSALAVLSTVPKVAALVLLHRVFIAVDIQSMQWLYTIMGVLGILTIIVGTFGALRQSNAKRLIAYGAIAHSGFLFAALIISDKQGAIAFLWYAVIYMVMNLAIFYLLAVFEKQGITEVDDFSGLGSKESFLGGLLVVVLIALVGLPPTAGFTAKFYLFSAMWGWYSAAGDPLMLTYLGVSLLSVVFSLFFYLKIPFSLFIKPTEKSNDIKSKFIHRLLATIFTGLVLWIFFRPDLLNNIAENIKLIAW